MTRECLNASALPPLARKRGPAAGRDLVGDTTREFNQLDFGLFGRIIMR